jgi:hypothetical protein
MKSFLIILTLLGISLFSYSQNVYQIRADSVRIYNTCDTAELILENRTQNVPGFLYNKGRGRTEFRKLTFDSTFILGMYKNNATGDSILTTDPNGVVKLVHKNTIGSNIYNTDGTFTANRTGSLLTRSLLLKGINGADSSYLYLRSDNVKLGSRMNPVIGGGGLAEISTSPFNAAQMKWTKNIDTAATVTAGPYTSGMAYDTRYHTYTLDVSPTSAGLGLLRKADPAAPPVSGQINAIQFGLRDDYNLYFTKQLDNGPTLSDTIFSINSWNGSVRAPAYKNNQAGDSVLTTDTQGNIKLKYVSGGGNQSLQQVTDNGDSTTHPLLIGGNNNGAGLSLSTNIGSGDFGFCNAYIRALNSGSASELPGNLNFYGYALFFDASYTIVFQRNINVYGDIGATGRYLSSVNGVYTELGEYNGGAAVGSTSYNPLIFRTNSDEKARISIEGNMGIGTANPTAKLEVNGQVKITGGTPGAGKVLTSDENGLATWQTPSAGAGAFSIQSQPQIATVTDNTTLTESNYTVLANNTSNMTISLPAAAANTGRIYFIKKISNNGSTVTVTPSGGETIDGASNYSISAYNRSIQVQSNGSAWYILTVM